ncbi:inosine triphosphate pyrophosphatase-like protein [Paraphysoderma sedebokerense]|nr:inosine triphosphate pyrophosphatase-like protein [Paraphysoderma sedebokerense]
MKIAVHSLTSNLKGPMFPFFVESLSSVPDSVYILTARLQKSETIHSGLEYLLKCGWLPDIPKVGNIWPVANQGFNERVKKYLGVDLCTNDQMTNWSRNKGLFLQILRQKLGEQIFEEGEEQDRTKERILIKYSDDDYGNVQSVMECLGHMESAVDVAVYYTGDLVPPFATLISSRTSPVLSVSPEFDRRDIPATSNRNPLYLNRNPPPPVSTVIHSIFGGVVKVNTSNIIKLNEFKKYMSYYGHEGEILVEKNDLQEPDSDFVTIARYKASQFQNVLVDDTSLFIDFSSLPSHPLSSHQSAPPQLGTNVKHLLKTLDKYIGYSACFISILAIRVANKILIYRGEVSGTIVPRADPSNISMQLPIDQLGFLPWFKPNGQEKTLTEEFRDEVNARWHAMKELLEGREPWMVCDVLEKWDGKWQDE